MTDGITHRDSGKRTGDGTVIVLAQGDAAALKKSRKIPAVAKADDELRDLKKELSYLRRQVHGLRSRLHGELAVLAVRIEDNDQRSMRRRAVMRRWAIAAIVAAWLWQVPGLVVGMLAGSFLLPGLLLVGMTTVAGITITLLLLHTQADEQDHKDRYRNWFRLTVRDDA
jgi:hypothetical protein